MINFAINWLIYKLKKVNLQKLQLIFKNFDTTIHQDFLSKQKKNKNFSNFQKNNLSNSEKFEPR